MTTEDTDLQARLSQVARIAVGLEATTGCPPTMLIAQWAVESRWGAKPAGHANYFGIKKNARDPECCTEPTVEVVDGKPEEETLEFADYDSLENSCKDYALLITTGAPYRAAWQAYKQSHELGALIVAVAKMYATDPNYAALVSLIAGQTNVARAIAAARQEPVNA